MTVHNHPPYRPPCNERRLPDGSLHGACLPDDPAPDLHSCGYPEGSFACKIRHLHLNTGAAKAARD